MGDYVLLRPFVEMGFTLTFLLFLTFSLGTRFVGNLSREVRFNAQQAVLIDVALIFPQLLGEASEGLSLPRSLLEPSSNFIWIALWFTVTYCVSSNLRGKKPDEVPFISYLAEIAVGPF